MKIIPFETTYDLNQFSGLEYVTVNVPAYRVDGAEKLIELPDLKIGHTVAKAIINKRVPIRGKEVRFFRKVTLEMTLQEFSQILGMSPTAIFKWEKNSKARLHRINEAAVLTLMIDRIEMRRFQIRFSDLCTNIGTGMPAKMRIFIRQEPKLIRRRKISSISDHVFYDEK